MSDENSGADPSGELRQTPLHALSTKHGGRMVPFAGYEMPVQYASGVLREHLHTRAKAGLFDVSHMGQVVLRGRDPDATRAALERLVPADIVGLAPGRQRYGVLTNDEGGIEDDLMIANHGAYLVLVVNAARKDADIALIRASLAADVVVKRITNRALLALQGPAAVDVLAEHAPAVRDMRFMDVATLPFGGAECWVSRSGYTGEDGFEISIPESAAEHFARALLAHDDVALIGLGARDSLRLEAGLCLYGQDLTAATSPVEAGLSWAIPKCRRSGGERAGGFPGASRILAELVDGVQRRRVGLRPQGRAPMRAGTPLFDRETGGAPVGEVTSGGFGATIGGPIAMGYVDEEVVAPAQVLFGEVRGKRLPATVTELPFVASRYQR